MTLILTYHQVCDSAAGAEPGFYAITPAQLERHLHILKERNFQIVKMEELANSSGTNSCVLTFDDATVDHYESVLPILEKNRCKGSFYVPTAKLNSAGFLTDSQVREIAKAGHEIGSHSHEHERMDRLPDEEVRNRIARSMEIIGGITGEKPRTFVPPGGFMNANIAKIAQDLGIKALRTMRWGYNLKLDLMGLETVPLNRYTDEQKFAALLEPRGPSLIYAGKEALKKVMPLRNYEKLRGLVFKLRKM